MPKPITSYIRASGASAATWLLNSTTVTLNSLTAYLNGYFTPTAPDQLDFKNNTAYAQIPKNNTRYLDNPNYTLGILANDLVVKANSTTVKATGYTGNVPNMFNKPVTTYAEA